MRLAPARVPAAALFATGARLSTNVAPRPMTSTPTAMARSAPRHSSVRIALAAISGIAIVPAPIPALAMPAASPRLRENHGCTLAIAGV